MEDFHPQIITFKLLLSASNIIRKIFGEEMNLIRVYFIYDRENSESSRFLPYKLKNIHQLLQADCFQRNFFAKILGFISNSFFIIRFYSISFDFMLFKNFTFTFLDYSAYFSLFTNIGCCATSSLRAFASILGIFLTK